MKQFLGRVWKIKVSDRLIPGGDFPFTQEGEMRQRLMKTGRWELTGSDR